MNEEATFLLRSSAGRRRLGSDLTLSISDSELRDKYLYVVKLGGLETAACDWYVERENVR